MLGVLYAYLHLKQSSVYLDIVLTLHYIADNHRCIPIKKTLKCTVSLVIMASNQESDIFLKSFHGSSNKMENENSTNLDIEVQESKHKEVLRKHSHEDILQWLRDKNLGNITSNIVMKGTYSYFTFAPVAVQLFDFDYR